MRVLATLLLLCAAVTAKVPSDNIYWEGEDDASNEFLEVDNGITGHLQRFKRQESYDPSQITENYESVTADYEDTHDNENEYDGGSGFQSRVESESKEKTLHVSFVVPEPYKKSYSNRDSEVFQNFSKSLSKAVNEVFQNLPGTHKASLVRIQSRPKDSFSYKVTMELDTMGPEETDMIVETLRDHITKKRKLGAVTVDITDFSYTVIDPDRDQYQVQDQDQDQDQYRYQYQYQGQNQNQNRNQKQDLDQEQEQDGDQEQEQDGDQEQEQDETPDQDQDETPEQEQEQGQDRDQKQGQDRDRDQEQDGNREQDGDQKQDEDQEQEQDGDQEQEQGQGQDRDQEQEQEQEQDGDQDGDPDQDHTVLNEFPREDTANYNNRNNISFSDNRHLENENDIPEIATADPLDIDPSEEDQHEGESDINSQNGNGTPTSCPDNYLNCDGIRCIPRESRCNGYKDCHDGTDEANCESCGADDFYCNNGQCIESAKRCDDVTDCPTGEDELGCECQSDEFMCKSDGACIESRKRCDNVDDCKDGSDEFNCPCTSDQWQCDRGSCIKRSKRCNGRVDCPTDRSDERHCVVEGHFKCRTGKLIPEYQRCNRHYDCNPGDYSDEQNCPCGDGDFKCDNGYCIPASKKCDRTHDCQDGSDERDCTYGTVSMASQYNCSNGQRLPVESRCNGTSECLDGSDEKDCPCKRDQFQCQDNSCINIAKRCNGQRDCEPFGEDEYNCEESFCPPDKFTCDFGSDVLCATRCDGKNECSAGEDEENCPDCNHVCDGNCLEDHRICNGVKDCSDNSDEQDCPECNGINDFRCHNKKQCLNIALHCNGIFECSDESDELNCSAIRAPEPAWFITRPSRSPTTTTLETTTCHEAEFTCYDGRCIPHIRRCDNIYDCLDFSDEQNCYNSACGLHEWSCSSGQCISAEQYCDDNRDCIDGSDENNCLTTETPITNPPSFYPYTDPPSTVRPNIDPYPSQENRNTGFIALDLKIHPKNQTVRNIHSGGDVTFSCRDESDLRTPVRWVREGGKPLKPGSTDRNGRLEMEKVTSADSGVYICQAPRYLGSPGSEVQVTLYVEKHTLNAVSPFRQCTAFEATCGNGQCIARSSICDGRLDCKDGSDEDSCSFEGLCDPNQFQCANRKCILNYWVCDSENDCMDGSDELNCGVYDPNSKCTPVEFKCHSNDQCIPRTFHCDGHTDCPDMSDELNCAPVYITRPPTPANIRLNPGETLTLTCEAQGVPIPLITWRLNWRRVPEKCTSTSTNEGIGTLTCPDMQPEDSGAYSCEGTNNRGSSLASQDSIVFVNRTEGVCPAGYFNSEARSQNECIRCFCFGKSVQCQSADLFIFNMPPLLGEGGTRLVGVKSTRNGDIIVEKDQQITEQYYYEGLRNGAMVTKHASALMRNIGSHPYVTLPEAYNGNQLTSYGGAIKYRLSPHNIQRYSINNDIPDIIIVGKYQTLLHRSRNDRFREPNIHARLTPGDWQKASSRGLVQATREDMMMALDDITMILLRADLNNVGVNITDFNMESAQRNNVGLGSASLVEECTCPEGYKGRSCEKCSDGYEGQSGGPWNGTCVPKAPCPPLTYGDPNSGGDCKPCPCPLTNRGNQFARSCAVGSGGNVVCECQIGYEGPDCSYCASNYYGNPLIPGDFCKPIVEDNCNKVGTLQIRPPDECVCKENVQGRYCDQCKSGSFYLSNDFRHGCALCFCSGVSQKCTISNLHRKTTSVRFNVPQIVDKLKVYNIDSVRYSIPIETELQPELYNDEVYLRDYERSQSSILYWSLPESFAGDKVTSYGGRLNYELKHVSTSRGQNFSNTAADVYLISDNKLTFHYFGNFVPDRDGYLNATVEFLEKGWQRSDGKEIFREHFLLALADVKAILIKATYSKDREVASIVSATIETAERDGNGPLAQHVEQCLCPKGYIGTSCEDCAPGFTRIPGGLYLNQCAPCNCTGHSSNCHPETGICFDCNDNTEGNNCENCKDGYQRDQYNNCVLQNPTERPTCNCDPRGEDRPCDDLGRCSCKQNVEGEFCDRCRPGTFGLDYNNQDGCSTCYCSGVTNDCYEATHYSRLSLGAPIFDEDNGGYTLMNLNADQVINDQFQSAPKDSELTYTFTEQSPIEDLYWSLPNFPGNQILSYGGSLSLTQKFEAENDITSTSDNDVVLIGGGISIYWTNPVPLRSGIEQSYQVPLREDSWYILNTRHPVSRNEFMSVLKNLNRVLVKATLSTSIYSTSIADVSMDTAIKGFETTSVAAKGIEICKCPDGYTGTSCELCTPGYYRDRNDKCQRCNCNGYECQINSYDQVICNCLPPYTGPDCSTVGLIMELHPTLHDDHHNSSIVNVTFTCKYRAPEPLSIKFYFEGLEIHPEKHYTESKLYKDGWRGEHTWHTFWNTKRQGEIYECRTITEKGFTLGVLSTTLPEKAGDPDFDTTTRPPPPQSTIVVKISSPIFNIREIGGTINFTCEAKSRISQSRLNLDWYKADGYLPQDRTQTDRRTGMLLITNLQESDSGKYICQSSDGQSTSQAYATLKVPGNGVTLPNVTISPVAQEYYEGDRIQLNCEATGNPAPRIGWQRVANRALPQASETFDTFLIIERASVEDTGEYRCIASNTAGSSERTALITVHPKVTRPRDKLTVSSSAPEIYEGQSIRVTCTGTVNIPVGTIDWIRSDGTKFLQNVRSADGILYVDNARLDNQGVYICQTASYQVEPVLVVLTILATSTPPQEQTITIPVKDLRIPTGGIGKVECNPHGYPLPLIKWTKYGKPLGAGTSQRENELIITNAQESDQDYYLCEGIVDGKTVAQAYIYVFIEKREAPVAQIYPPGESAVALGSQFHLYCNVTGGTPAPIVTWERNGGPAIIPRHIDIIQNNTLLFNTIEVNDEGQYTCTATNEAGFDSATATVRVQSLPEITIKPGYDIIANQYDSLEIECRAEGRPKPIVSIISRLDSREIVPPSQDRAILSITSVNYSDEGEYICIAVSDAGTTREEFYIRIERGDGGNGYYGSGGGDEDYDQYEPISKLVIEGQTTSIGCDVPLGYKVTWNRSGKPQLQYNARVIGNKLIISNTSKSDSGRYECILIDERTGDAQRSIYTSLQVMSPPRITLRPPTQTVQPGDSPVVKCVAEGDEISSVAWRPVNRWNSSRIEIQESTLIFHDIEVEDAGEYECIAMNPIANATAVAEVIVSEESHRTTSESHGNEQTAHVGSAVHLSCNVTQPGYTILWTKDGRSLPRSVKQKNDGSLFIRLAQKSDTGRYVCIIRDAYGRQTTNYITLQIEGNDCLATQFRCYDGSGCIDEELLCDGYNHCSDLSDENNCITRDKRLSKKLLDRKTNLTGPRKELSSFVTIDKPRGPLRVGENLKILCRGNTRDITVHWKKYKTQEYVQSTPYGDGMMLEIPNVQQADAGVYRCIGQNDYRQLSYQDFNLEVIESREPTYPNNDDDMIIEARVGENVNLPCDSDLESASKVWRREYSQKLYPATKNERGLYLDNVTEADAGTYICRVSNSRGEKEYRVTLKVIGVIPKFSGDGWLALNTLKDAHIKFYIEVSFKPSDHYGVILYNSQNKEEGDYLILELINGVPQFTLKYDSSSPLVLTGDRPLQLNVWHTIRLSRAESRVMMAVDKNDPFIAELPNTYVVLDLYEPLYIGGIPDLRPYELQNARGFFGCVSMLILGEEEKNIMGESILKHNVKECDSCTPNLCLNNGVCQEARNEQGYTCICATGYAGLNCDRSGEACHYGLCGPGKCTDTADGYRCACPVTYTGRNCDVKQNIEYPAFTGSAYLAVKPPRVSRFLRMSMKIKAKPPVTDGIIMYCAQLPRGYGGFTSLAVHNRHLEFRYDLGNGTKPIVLISNRTLEPNTWTTVSIASLEKNLTLKINMNENYEATLASRKHLTLDTPIFVGGVDDSIFLNNNIGVTVGFSGCIKDVMLYNEKLDLIHDSIESANIQQCENYERGDISSDEEICSQCRNNGFCVDPEQTSCTCPSGFTGQLCEKHEPNSNQINPCASSPCQNGGTCKVDRNSVMGYTCDCRLGFSGTENCQTRVNLGRKVGFSGNGYLELPANLLQYDQLSYSPALIALSFHTYQDGLLLYQRESETSNQGDYVQIRVKNGAVVLDWDAGSGRSRIINNNSPVSDGQLHTVILKFLEDKNVELTVDSVTETGRTTGISDVLNVDSNIYLGGVPEHLKRYINEPGLVGCIEQVEFNRGIGENLGRIAVAGRNTQQCRENDYSGPTEY